MKSICTIAIAVLLSTGAWAQPIGYQGKTFIISAGLGLGSNLPYYSGYVPFTDDSTPPGEDIGIVVKPIPHVQIEYTIFDATSILVRWQSMPLEVNANLYAEDETFYTLTRISAKGNMFGLGYKSYFTQTPAPLSNYFSIMAFMYPSQIEITEHPDYAGINPFPTSLQNTTFDKVTNYGLSLGFGIQDIFFDKLTVDYAIELAYIFKNFDESTHTFDDLHYEGYNNPNAFTYENARTLLFASPMIHVGYLLF